MTRRGSRRTGLLTVLGSAMLLALSACGVPKTQESMNIHGASVDEDTRARVDRLVSYCQKLSEGGNFYLSAGMCQRAHDLDPTNPLPLMVMAENFEKHEKFDEALQAYSVVLENHPKNVTAAQKLSKLQLARGYDHAALRTLQDALVHNPNDPKLLNTIGVVKDQQGDHETAQFYYRESLAQNPDNVSVANNLGLSLALSGQPEEAVRILNDVVDDPAAPPTSRSNLALAYAAVDAAAADQAKAGEDTSDELQDGEESTSRAIESEYLDEKGASLEEGFVFGFNRDSTIQGGPGQPLPLQTTSFAPLSSDPLLKEDYDIPVPGEHNVAGPDRDAPFWWIQRRVNRR